MAWLAVVALLACAEETREPRAPLTPRASWLLEPTLLAVGAVGTLELAVVTPPHHHPRAFVPPETLPGLWLLQAEALPVSEHATHWIHHTRLRVRAREVGSFALPEGVVTVEGPDGSVLELAYPALPIEVASVMPEYPDRLRPFGADALPAAPTGGDALVWSAAGAGLALATVGLVWLARRTRAPEPEGPAAPGTPPWVAARRTLDEARARAAVEPVGAANDAARCLRCYLAARFGADASARTTEELGRLEPPFALTTRWPAVVALLGRLDALRFPRAGADPARAIELLGEVATLVEETVPLEERGHR